MGNSPIHSVGILGAGTMGAGIAQVAAQAGLRVILCDVSKESLDRALKRIRRNIERGTANGTQTAQEISSTLARIVQTEDYATLGSTDFVIEAVLEDLDTKSAAFATLSRIVGAHVPLASNTSSISITRLASSAFEPGRVVGMHFMNPVHRMALVEIVRGLETSQETVETTERLAKTLGKTPVVVSDSPGFVSNRLLMPMINEAAFCLMEGVGTKQSIDTIMKLGMNHPMGPLALADLIGIDVCLDVMEVLYSGFGDSKYRPCPLLRKMVAAGQLGRKSGRGFYEYPAST